MFVTNKKIQKKWVRKKKNIINNKKYNNCNIKKVINYCKAQYKPSYYKAKLLYNSFLLYLTPLYPL